MSWINRGDNHEQGFWCLLALDGTVGLAAGIRHATDEIYLTWTRYAQTLYGDPAMRVWDHVPRELQVTYDITKGKNRLRVEVRLDGMPVTRARVTLTSLTDRTFFASALTNFEGGVGLTIPEAATRLGARLQLTVSSRKGKLYRDIITF